MVSFKFCYCYAKSYMGCNYWYYTFLSWHASTCPEIVGHGCLMFVYFRIFIWLLCMELQWGCQTNHCNSYFKYDLKNVHMGPPSGAVIEAIGSMHVCRECVSTVQKNSLHWASFRHPLPLPILYNSIFDTFSKLVFLSLRPDLKNVHMACYSSMFNKSMFKVWRSYRDFKYVQSTFEKLSLVRIYADSSKSHT